MKNLSKRQTMAVALLAAGLISPGAPAMAAASPTETPKSQELAISQPGNYLAGLIASADRDQASAEEYYREALRIDPRNTDLLERTFAAALSNGDEQGADTLAERLLTRDPTNNLARLAVAVHAIGQGQYAAARAQLMSGDVRTRDVTAALLTAWCYAGQDDLRHALDTLDRIRDPSVAAFRDYNAGLIADQLGNVSEARRRLKSAYDADKKTLRFSDAYARFLAAHGDADGAKSVYADFSKLAPHHPVVERALADLDAGRIPDPVVRTPKDGAAEVLYGLGAAGGREGDELPALIYLRLSLYLRPSSDLTAVTLANVFERLKQTDQAIAAYKQVPPTSPFRKDADIQAALLLDGEGKSDEAMRQMADIVAARPKRRRGPEFAGRPAARRQEIRRRCGDLRQGDRGGWRSAAG